MTRDLISGVVSSLLVVLFVEGYLRLRRRYSRRSLRRALGNTRSATVVASVMPNRSGNQTIVVMATHDAYAIAHILAAYYTIGVRPSVVSAARLPDGLNDNIVCIGGPTVNSLTAAHLKQFCAAFQRVDEGPGLGAFRCGAHEFVLDDERDWGFLVRLSPELTGRVHLTTLVWGIGVLGTAGAGYFLAELHQRLPKMGETAPFFLAIPIQRAIGYQGVSTSVTDLTADVWPAQQGAED